jgi:RimJ/RimL family protein N-acetyltransferase
VESAVPRALSVGDNPCVRKDTATRLDGRLVVLAPLAAEHKEPLWQAASADPSVWDWMTIRGGDSRELFSRWFDFLRAEQAAERVFPFATLVRGVPAGHTSFLNLRERDRSVEIGHTWLSRAAWGTGANTEAKLLLLEHAFERMGCHRVEFKTDASNERARAALAAIPAQFEGVHRRHMIVRDGERRDSAWYSVIVDEWPDVRAALQRRLDKKLRG